MSGHFDVLEARDPKERERDLLNRLPRLIAYAVEHARYFASTLQGTEATRIYSREALATLPVLRKSDLIEIQKAQRPFGGLAAQPWGRIGRVLASPGPIYEPEGRKPDYWRSARALFAAGFRAGDLVHNSFNYHMSPGAWIIEAGALAVGCTVFPAGVGQTEQQLQAMVDLQPDGYVGTPSFLRTLLEKADETGVKIASLKKALVSGEAFLPAVRDSLKARGIDAYQAYAVGDIGVIAYETPAREGLVVDEEVILEILRPGTGEPLPPGEVGEVVVTVFNETYPLIRFATGDLSAVIPESFQRPSKCGRTNLRISGWMGRADQAAKVRGLFVHPAQIAAVLKRHPEVARARLVVTNPDSLDTMTLHCEGPQNGSLASAIAETLKEFTKLRAEVVFVPALPNDGKVIEDLRKFD